MALIRKCIRQRFIACLQCVRLGADRHADVNTLAYRVHVDWDVAFVKSPSNMLFSVAGFHKATEELKKKKWRFAFLVQDREKQTRQEREGGA